MIGNTERIKACTQWDDNNIKGFFGEYRFLSNFHVCDIYYEELIYPSTEAAYQAAKTLHVIIRRDFQHYTPSHARKKGQELHVRDDWNKVKDVVMLEVCMDKFTRHKDLQEKLLATGDKHLEESNWWKDVYWGTYKGNGRNQLGITLMKIRSYLLTLKLPQKPKS